MTPPEATARLALHQLTNGLDKLAEQAEHLPPAAVRGIAHHCLLNLHSYVAARAHAPLVRAAAPPPTEERKGQ